MIPDDSNISIDFTFLPTKIKGNSIIDDIVTDKYIIIDPSTNK